MTRRSCVPHDDDIIGDIMGSDGADGVDENKGILSEEVVVCNMVFSTLIFGLKSE